MKSNSDHKEGKVAKTLENETSKIPSDVYLWAALGSMALALGCFASGKKHTGLLIGQWAPSLLVIGLYNKLVKIAGHDKQDKVKKEKQVKQQESFI